MKSLFSFLRHPANLESDAVIRSVVVLRIAILGLMFLSLLYSHLNIEPYTHWRIALATFSLTGLWSVFVLLKPKMQNTPTAALREILVDIAWIFIVVYFSGRSTNPFIYYYLVITAYAAILLDLKKAWMLCGLGVLLYSGLLLADVRLHFAHFSMDFRNHLIGMWINFVGSSFVITFFVSSLIQALRNQQQKMLVTREKNLKNEQLIGLATVSASTVHNLATPLSTLSVLIDDLEEDQELNKEHAKDLGLMRDQITRCRLTMKELSQLASNSNELTMTLLSDLIADLDEHYSLHFPDNMPLIESKVPVDITMACTPLFKYAVINLLNNAIESSTSKAALTVLYTEEHVRFTIKNKVNETAEKLTERWGQPTSSKKEFGLGIGSFLANSTIEQQGGSVSLNVTPTEGSLNQCLVEVTIEIPALAAETLKASL